ncbi:MAG: BBP7 family outer membrane beta-barrel protein, partial [Planctomycetia bacterium]|nr:BBP7 family outer membrane beta-barrel protein [Planctomycetia bacterium]
ASKFFLPYDFLYWTISPPKTSKIGSTQLEGDYTRGGVTTHFENSLDTSFMDFEFHSGHRVEFGCRDCYSGWLVGYAYGAQTQGLVSDSVNFLPGDPGFPDFSQSYLAGYADGNGDGIDDDLNVNTIYGRFGQDRGTPDGMGGYTLPPDGTPDVPAPTDTGDLQIYLPVFAEASVQNTLTMTNLEVMYFTRMNRDHASNFEFLYGVRYLDLEDYFAFRGTGGTLDATSVSVTSENQLLGLQLGARWQKRFGAWYLNAEGRFLAAANMQDNKMYGSVASNILTNSNGQNGPINLNPQSFNYVSSNNEWAPLGELRIQAILPINDWMAFRLGYTGFVADGISRASQKVDYVLPRFGLNRSASDEVVVFSSFNLGFEINR